MFFLHLLLFNAFIATLIKVYSKLTTGICKCSRHLVGKVVIITGGNAGIGYETSKDLAARGARVILACRSEAKGIEARDSIIASTGNKDVHYRHLDLSSLASVKSFADGVISTEKRIDVLINNAGVYEVDNLKTEDGLALAMQTNHFGPFLLTRLLLPLLKSSAPSRVIIVSSNAHFQGKVDLDNLNNEKETGKNYSPYQVYSNTKLCNILMSHELARRLEGTGVTSNSLHPGVVATDILLSLKKAWGRHFMPFLKLFFKTPWEGAQTTVFLAVSPEVETVSGEYWADCRVARHSGQAQDKELARKLWEKTEKFLGLQS